MFRVMRRWPMGIGRSALPVLLAGSLVGVASGLIRQDPWPSRASAKQAVFGRRDPNGAPGLHSVSARTTRIAAKIRSLATTPVRGTFFRSIDLHYMGSPLSAIGSILDGGRYNHIGDFEVLYLANTQHTTSLGARARRTTSHHHSRHRRCGGRCAMRSVTLSVSSGRRCREHRGHCRSYAHRQQRDALY